MSLFVFVFSTSLRQSQSQMILPEFCHARNRRSYHAPASGYFKETHLTIHPGEDAS